MAERVRAGKGPATGGAVPPSQTPLVRVGDGPIDVEELLASAGGRADGAVVLFVGVVRDHNLGRPVGGVRYEAYQPMAESVLRDIGTEALARFDISSLAAVHRTGELCVGDASLAIVVAGAHRGPAYDGSRYIIEEIKKRLPVWKEERYLDGDTAWVPGVQPPDPDRGSA